MYEWNCHTIWLQGIQRIKMSSADDNYVLLACEVKNLIYSLSWPTCGAELFEVIHFQRSGSKQFCNICWQGPGNEPMSIVQYNCYHI